jgi:hypothetical protein
MESGRFGTKTMLTIEKIEKSSENRSAAAKNKIVENRRI